MNCRQSHALNLGLVAVVLHALLLVGCSDKLVPPDTSNTLTSELKGAIINESGKPIPEDATIVILWEGRRSMYVHGTGTIDRTTNTYSIPLTPPPLEGSNKIAEEYPSFIFGVGIIYVVPDSIAQTELAEGTILTSEYTGPFYGSTEFSGIIYLNSDPAILSPPGEEDCRQKWLSKFHEGFSFGVGKPATNEPASGTCTFDQFAPVVSGGLNVIIDTNRNNFPWVNWT